ncbi:carboxy-S-adenosyl-L-methionine synthase CmoA [Paraflavitalea soli]|uniref:Carboxy-S-adenosyl-L-methionine synthase n=1 Tax=Paraflavitalea soli TaxID=2315862 RepID=A0A3B7MKN8_9BACT|nr:carboxy-S-adenosyl-L-methionine synthase CmoA [Paraflavitalea soli]AXY74217.1 carboxy-S-adenosyl-L-methionine synthase CmoA [Paraflavitalea soli]
MHKDEVFKEAYLKPIDFTFSSKVAGVFDDMVNRSVPFYEEMQRMVAELAADHCQHHTKIYDLGCSTGTTLIHMDHTVPADIAFVGVDDSVDMLHKCRQKLESLSIARPYDLQVEDLNRQLLIQDASVVVLCLTLQFVRPINRERLLKEVVDGLVPGGVVIIIEKILAEDSGFNRDFIKYYYDMKRRHHYSDMEIAQKREALENVLIPYKLSENITLLQKVGFDHCEVFFKWYNFAGIIAKKF